MSEGKVTIAAPVVPVGVVVGASAVAAVAALAIAAKKICDFVADEVEKEQVAKQRQNLDVLIAELEKTQDAAKSFNEKVDGWELKARCKALDERCQKKANLSGTLRAKLPVVIPANTEGDSKSLKLEVERLERDLAEQDRELRNAYTQALRSHVAAQGVNDAIDKMAALATLMLETSSDRQIYDRQLQEFWNSRINISAVAAQREIVDESLKRLREMRITPGYLQDLSSLVAEFAVQTEAGAAQISAARIGQKITEAIEQADRDKPLRERLEQVRQDVRQLIQIPTNLDLEWLFSELPTLDEKRIADAEQIVKVALENSNKWLQEQQRKVVLQATAMALLNLGYQTSISREQMMKWDGRQLFITRPEWGNHVVRVTPENDNENRLRFFVGRTDIDGNATVLEDETRKMIDTWCDTNLPRIRNVLEKQNIELKVVEDLRLPAVQRVSAAELGALADDVRSNSAAARLATTSSRKEGQKYARASEGDEPTMR